MKMIKIEKFGIIVVLSLLLSVQVAKSIGISSPIPIGLKLLKGETARFYFEIMATTSPEKISCVYTATGLTPLVITFDETEGVVDAGEIKPVYGTISVPNDAPIKTYPGSLVATCGAYKTDKDFSGSVVRQIITVGFTVDVVETKEERQVVIVSEQIKEINEKPKASPIILVLIIIVLIIAIVGFYFSRKKKIE